MVKVSSGSEFLSDFLDYLANMDVCQKDKLPPLGELKADLGVSISSLREQLEVARALGLVEVHPRTGIRRLPYSFFRSIKASLFYSLTINQNNFQLYSELREHIEASYWEDAVIKLTPNDIKHLQELVDQAWLKLRGQPVQIPQFEHRELHLSIYKRLENPFVTGLLEGYWEMYDAVGLNLYTDYDYLERVWQYHQEMVQAISLGDFSEGHHLLVDHMHLLSERPVRKNETNGYVIEQS
jgi:DNA-binding FadR family transcriptional regulator